MVAVVAPAPPAITGRDRRDLFMRDMSVCLGGGAAVVVVVAYAGAGRAGLRPKRGIIVCGCVYR